MSSQSATTSISINIVDLISIIILAILTNCISELLSYLLIYKTRKYKDLNKTITIQMKKIEVLKASLVGPIRQTDKKLKRMEAELKSFNFDMMKLRMGSMFIIGLFFIFFMSIFSSVFQGVIVAKLPFEPIRLISNLSHRGILSTDPCDCSFIFIFILSNLTIRPILQKILGTEGPRNANQFANMFGGESSN